MLKKRQRKNLAKLIECKGPVYEDCKSCPEYPTCQGDVLSDFTKHENIIIDKYMKVLSGAEWKVLSYMRRLAHYSQANREYGYCFVTWEEIQEVTGLSLESIRRSLHSLEFGNSKHQGQFIKKYPVDCKVYREKGKVKVIKRVATKYELQWMLKMVPKTKPK